MSTSRVVLLRKLRERGHSVLADAAENGDVSAFAAAQYVGIVRAREPAGNGSENAARLNAWRIHQVLRGTEDLNGAAKPVAEPTKHAPAPMLTPGGSGSLPCMTCSAAT